MAKSSKKGQKTRPEEFVIAAFAEDLEKAREYESLLKAEKIPVVTKPSGYDENETKGIAVMVPEEHLDEAHVVIESQDAYDDFYDFVLEGEEDTDFDSDLFEDDF